MQAALIGDIETLTITQGQGVGAPMRLFAWEKRFLRGAFSPNVQSAALSIARGNGKTALCAAIATAAVDGVLRQSRGETIIVASSLSQAKIAFDHVLAFLRARYGGELDRKIWQINDTPQRAAITHKPSGAAVRCIGSDPKRAHGLAPTLILADEPAQWEAAKADRMIAALRTSMGKIPNARLIALGTQPDKPEHWFSRMLHTQGAADYVQVHSAPENSPLTHKTTWRKANPSMDGMPELEKTIRKEAQRARQDAMEAASFRALRLNQPVSDVVESVLIEASTWRGIEADNIEYRGAYVLGVDLGTNAAMSAAAAYYPLSGALDAFAVFPVIPSLAERGIRDGVSGLYVQMHGRGELLVSGAQVSSISGMLGECVKRWGKPVAIVCDRWRDAELRQELNSARFPSGAALVVRGQGYKDGGEDVRDFRKAVLDGQVKAPISLLLRSAISEARVISDPAGNSKLAKKTEGGRRGLARDDAAAAAILAISEGYRRLQSGALRAPKKRRIRIAG